jgi:hypothetical protein
VNLPAPFLFLRLLLPGRRVQTPESEGPITPETYQVEPAIDIPDIPEEKGLGQPADLPTGAFTGKFKAPVSAKPKKSKGHLDLFYTAVRRIKGRHAAHAASTSQICKPADRISLTQIPYTFIFIIPAHNKAHNNNITTNHVNHTFPEYHDWMKSKIAEKIIWGCSSLVLFLPRPPNRVRKLLCNLRSFNYRRVHSTRRSKSF